MDKSQFVIGTWVEVIEDCSVASMGIPKGIQGVVVGSTMANGALVKIDQKGDAFYQKTIEITYQYLKVIDSPHLPAGIIPEFTPLQTIRECSFVGMPELHLGKGATVTAHGVNNSNKCVNVRIDGTPFIAQIARIHLYYQMR